MADDPDDHALAAEARDVCGTISKMFDGKDARVVASVLANLIAMFLTSARDAEADDRARIAFNLFRLSCLLADKFSEVLDEDETPTRH